MDCSYCQATPKPAYCRAARTVATATILGHYYHFKRGDRVTILWGRYVGVKGMAANAFCVHVSPIIE